MERSEIFKNYQGNREEILHILHDIQDARDSKYLTEEDLDSVAKFIGISKTEVMGVATFYSMYSLNKRGKNIIRLCISPSCHMMGATDVLDYLKEKLGINENETTQDGLFTIETASCLGICTHAPGMMINDKVYGNLTKEKIDSILDSYKKNDIAEDLTFTINEKDREENIILKGLGEVKPQCYDDYVKIGGFEGLKKALNKKPAEIVEEVKKSGLRGRGGAGFPTGLKWSFTAPLEGEKFIICNADEGEPGTFKDRLIMEGVPYRLIEGMIIAGYAIGANKGYIYIRGEYEDSIRMLEKVLDKAREKNVLGKNIMGKGFDFDIEIRKGAGAYVCGEETALIESMEGKRGNPRFKPPFPGVEGFRKLPSVVNNVETLANVPAIMEKGADWYSKIGSNESPGTKIYLLIGDVNKQGYIEAPTNITLDEIIEKYGKGIKDDTSYKAVLIGGAAGAILSKDAGKMVLDYINPKEYNAVIGSGAILVMNNKRNLIDLLSSILYFFKHESCGKCAPCRIGTKVMYDMIKKIAKGEGTKSDWEKMKDLAYQMKLTSFCPLGQSLDIPIGSFAKYFNNEMEKILK